MKTAPALPVATAAFLALAAPTTAVTIHVPAEQPTIQAGITAASDGDTVLVACDTYNEHIITMKSGVTLMSETGDPSCVTIDGQGTLGSIFRITGVHSCLIAGFTITGGRSVDGGGVYGDGSLMTFQECVFSDNIASSGGGGMHWDDGAVILDGCTFTGNQAGHGGGLHVNYSSAEITGCTFYDNDAGYGGGLAFEQGASLDAIGCTFLENTADAPGEGGGGAYVEGGTVQFAECGFEGNNGGEYGGGIYSYGSVDLTCTDCTFTSNGADYGGGIFTDVPASTVLDGCGFIGNSAFDGGGAYFYDDPDADIDECTFTGNSVGGGGGGATCDNSSCRFADCVFDGNAGAWGAALSGYYSTSIDVNGSTFALNRAPTAVRSDGTIYTWGAASADIVSSIVAFNTAEGAVYCESGGSATLSCSVVYGNEGGDWTGCIAGQDGVNGNLHVDPLFCGLLSGDYTLCSNSDCLPENNSCAVLMGARGGGCGECDSPVEQSSWGVIKATWR